VKKIGFLKKNWSAVLIVVLFLSAIYFNDTSHSNTTVFAYPDSDDIIGYADNIEEARNICTAFYGCPNAPTGISCGAHTILAERGYECLPFA